MTEHSSNAITQAVLQVSQAEAQKSQLKKHTSKFSSSTMSCDSPEIVLNRTGCKIDDLPDEVLEYILSLVPPYKDLEECSLVSKRWLLSCKRVMCHTQKILLRAVSNFKVQWENITPEDMAPSITKRYSHSSCRYKNSMFVFGGCTSTSTTFNDLWRLDLNRRQWVRPLTMGTYPSPKACASLVTHKDSLVLFGGWTHPSPYPLHQAWRLFNELHIYGTTTNRWTLINTETAPPSMAGHSASVQGDLMVVFGGLQKTSVLPGHYGSSNDLWVYDLVTSNWYQQPTSRKKPQPRYGQSHIRLDDTHMLIIGGCGGPNLVYSDVWLLTVTERDWTWEALTVRNPQWGAQHIWCHPACKVGDHVVVFSRNPTSGAPALPYTAQWNAPAHLRSGNNANVWVPPREEPGPRRESDRPPDRPMDRDENVNGRRGSLGRHQAAAANAQPQPAEPPAAPCRPAQPPPPPHRPSVPEVNAAGPMAAFRDPPLGGRTAGSGRNRALQLESLRRMEQRILALSRGGDPTNRDLPLPKEEVRSAKNPMTLFTLDISTALTEKYVQWLPYKSEKGSGPEETILFSLVAGKGELIMFGGIQKDATSIILQSLEATETVSNTLHFISAARGII